MPSSLEQLLSMGELRDVGMNQLKQRMLMQLLLQDPVEEGYADPTAWDHAGPDNNRPESKIKRYEPGSRDPGMARDLDMSPRQLSDMGDLSPSQIADGRPESNAAALAQLKKAMADRHEAWLIDQMSTQGARAQDISDSFHPPIPRLGPFPRLSPIADYQNRGRPDLGGAEMDRAAGMGVTARGGAVAPRPNLDTDPVQMKIRLNQLLYDRSLSKKQGYDIESNGYAPNAQIQELRAKLRALQGQ